MNAPARKYQKISSKGMLNITMLGTFSKNQKAYIHPGVRSSRILYTKNATKTKRPPVAKESKTKSFLLIQIINVGIPKARIVEIKLFNSNT